jgi:hypothetical protein
MHRLAAAALSLVLVDFVAATASVLLDYGPIGWIQPVMANPATMLVSVDLAIALCFAVFWMVRDAKNRGIASWPFVLLTLGTGSAGPLAYAIRVLLMAPATQAAQLRTASTA